jgi:hypothetical protein
MTVWRGQRVRRARQCASLGNARVLARQGQTSSARPRAFLRYATRRETGLSQTLGILAPASSCVPTGAAPGNAIRVRSNALLRTFRKPVMQRVSGSLWRRARAGRPARWVYANPEVARRTSCGAIRTHPIMTLSGAWPTLGSMRSSALGRRLASMAYARRGVSREHPNATHWGRASVIRAANGARRSLARARRFV